MAPPELASEPLLAALFDYWELKRARRAMPRRQDIDPLDMPPRLLPQVELVELAERGRLKLRLVGTAIVDAIGKEATGRYIDEAFEGEVRRFLAAFFSRAVAEQRPAVGRCWLKKAKGPDLGSTWLATPLSEDGHSVSMILAGATFRFARIRSLAEAERSRLEETIAVL